MQILPAMNKRTLGVTKKTMQGKTIEWTKMTMMKRKRTTRTTAKPSGKRLRGTSTGSLRSRRNPGDDRDCPRSNERTGIAPLVRSQRQRPRRGRLPEHQTALPADRPNFPPVQHLRADPHDQLGTSSQCIKPKATRWTNWTTSPLLRDRFRGCCLRIPARVTAMISAWRGLRAGEGSSGRVGVGVGVGFDRTRERSGMTMRMST